MKASHELCQIDHVDLHNCNLSTLFEYVRVNRFDKHLWWFFLIHKFHEILWFNCLNFLFVFVRQCHSYFFDRCFFCHEFLIVIVDAIDQLILCFCIEFFSFKTHVFVKRNDVVNQTFDHVVENNCYNIVWIHNWLKLFIFESLFHKFESFFVILMSENLDDSTRMRFACDVKHNVVLNKKRKCCVCKWILIFVNFFVFERNQCKYFLLSCTFSWRWWSIFVNFFHCNDAFEWWNLFIVV